MHTNAVYRGSEAQSLSVSKWKACRCKSDKLKPEIMNSSRLKAPPGNNASNWLPANHRLIHRPLLRLRQQCLLPWQRDSFHWNAAIKVTPGQVPNTPRFRLLGDSRRRRSVKRSDLPSPVHSVTTTTARKTRGLRTNTEADGKSSANQHW